MIIVDDAMKARLAEGSPLRVGMIGAGTMGRGLTIQVERYLPALHISVLCNRTVERAIDVYLAAGVAREDIEEVSTVEALETAIKRGRRAVTDDAGLLARCDAVDLAVDATGHVEYGAEVTLDFITNGKDLVSLNVELDATVGPLLRRKAEAAGIIFSSADGDQPAVTLNLVRHVEAMGLVPRVCGNIKGLHDAYRNPTTQQAYAAEWNQTPEMVTSFADGTKMSIEQAVVANATGMGVSQRGMIGRYHHGPVDDLVDFYDIEELRASGGIVDYVVGATPSPGVFVLAEARDENQAYFLRLGKLGEGPLYSFYTPWHLTVLESGISIARVGLCRDRVTHSDFGPCVDVVAVAKEPLAPGDTLDGMGGYKAYGVAENYGVSCEEGLLPMGLADGCRVIRPVPKDQAIGYADVETPADSLVHPLRREQDALFTAEPHRAHHARGGATVTLRGAAAPVRDTA